MRHIFHYILRAFCIVTGIALFLSIPGLFNMTNQGFVFDYTSFLDSFTYNFTHLFHVDHAQLFASWKKADMIQGYLYSVKLFVASTLVIIVTGFLLSGIVMMSPYRIRRRLKSIINFSEAVPDLLVIFILQISVIIIYKKTGIRLFLLYGFFSATPYFIPVVVISFLPTFFLAQFLLNAFEEEMKMDYAIFAKSKGLTFSRVYIIHLLRNIFPLFIVQMRTIIWVILSNLFLVEYLFSLNAYTSHLTKFNLNNAPETIVNIILFIIPIIIIELLIRLISILSRGKEEAQQ